MKLLHDRITKLRCAFLARSSHTASVVKATVQVTERNFALHDRRTVNRISNPQGNTLVRSS